MQRFWLLGLIAVLAFFQGEVRTEPRTETILIQPLGDYGSQDAVLVQKALTEFYGVPVVILPSVNLPADAYISRSKRYRADKLLSFLEKMPNDGYRIIGLTNVDISTTNGKNPDWGVVGLAVASGRVCVVSSFRCRMRTNDPNVARTRLAKVAVHELGHTLGLDHCATVHCLMQDARGSISTCDQEYDLCSHCRRRLQAGGYAVAGNPQVPWLLR